jgi:hypothetical protein
MKINKRFSIWLLINICILLYGITLYKIHPDGTIVLVYLMLLLTLPLGYIVIYILYIFSKVGLFGTLFQHYPILESIILPWVFFVVFGYIQWFILLPKIIEYTKRFRKR